MGDTEGALPPSKKRAAGRQITQLDPEPDDDTPEPEMGTFQRASEEVLATRRIVKARRHEPPSAPSSNPFAGIRLVPPTDSSARTTSTSVQPQGTGDNKVSEEQDDTNEKLEKTGEKETEIGALVNEPNGTEDSSKLENVADASSAKDGDKVKMEAGEGASKTVETGKEVENGGKETEQEVGEEHSEESREKIEKKAGVETDAVGEVTHKPVGEESDKEKQINDLNATEEPAAPVSSFQQLSSSQNAFSGLAGTGFSTSSFSFGSFAKEGSTFGASSGSLFGSSYPSFGIGSSNNGTSSSPLFGTTESDTTKNGGASSIPSMQEVPIETGEENEQVVFNADAALYEYLDGGWKGRGKGELKVNISISGAEKARLVMRAQGNYRLILNANLYPDMSLAEMDKRGITFACMNSAGEGKSGLTTFAVKFRDSTVMEEFRGIVTAHKGKLATVLKTPENSPKASDD